MGRENERNESQAMDAAAWGVPAQNGDEVRKMHIRGAFSFALHQRRADHLDRRVGGTEGFPGTKRFRERPWKIDELQFRTALQGERG